MQLDNDKKLYLSCRVSFILLFLAPLTPSAQRTVRNNVVRTGLNNNIKWNKQSKQKIGKLYLVVSLIHFRLCYVYVLIISGTVCSGATVFQEIHQ